MKVRKLLPAAVLIAAALLPLTSAQATTTAPAWLIDVNAQPAVVSAADDALCADCASLVITAKNVGAKPTNGSPITLSAALPVGLTASQIQLYLLKPERGGHNGGDLAGSDCEIVTLSCRFPNAVPLDGELEMTVHFNVEAGTEGSLASSVTVEGGGATRKTVSSQIAVSPTAAVPPYGFSAFTSYLADPNGEPSLAAGAHPYELHTRIDLASDFRESPLGPFAVTSAEDARDIIEDLPPGLVGSALSAPTCTLAQLSAFDPSLTNGVHCPPGTVVGFIRTNPGGAASIESPLYNIAAERGVAAEFGFTDVLNGSHLLYASLVPTPTGYVIRITSPEIPQIDLTSISIGFFGDPAKRDGEGVEGPTFTNPAECTGEPLLTHIYADSWQNPARFLADGEPDLADPSWVSQAYQSPPVSGCNQLAGLFTPTITARPETNQADSPTGLEVDLKVPQQKGVETLATPPLRKAVVTLPEGMTVNPSSANGLQGCSLSQLGISSSGQPNGEPPQCPEASKIGTVELETPALPGVLDGQIFVAKQAENPFKSLLAIYIVVNDPKTGVLVKIPGEIKADPSTGQLTTVVDNNPQLPFSELRTHFFGGQRAALRTPAVCGTYRVTSQLTPWSAPESGSPATPSSSFRITQGCAESAGEEPNHPAFSAGTVTPLAGSYSPFVLKLSREDGSQELKSLSVTLPSGLIGKLAGLSECSDAALASASAKSGAAEQATPSCPASSEVGTVTAGAGAGLQPLYASGRAYLAGPYKGAPLSLAVITPAMAGPFDLGTVVVRIALQVDPETAQITAVSDEIPHILQGIPLDLRSIALQMNRHEFTLNPTSCEKKKISGSLATVQGQSASLTNPFQVGGCKQLGFKPKLALRLKAGTRRHTFPALSATLTYPKGSYANISKAQVTLPSSEFLEQGHIGTVCTRVQFATKTCPAASIYGRATAITPLLAQPLSGPVYLRSSSNKLPDLVADLNGQIEVALDGRVDTGKGGGIRNTFEAVPDAPVSKFTLNLYGGKKGLLVNSENICSPKAKTKAVADFTAQNGKVYDTEPVVANSCGGRSKKAGKHHKGSKRRSARLDSSGLLGAW